MAMANITVPIQVNLPDDWIEQIVNRLRNDPESEWVEIVRCKDCGNWNTDWNPSGDGHYCGVIDLTTGDDFYCAYGERRSDE